MREARRRGAGADPTGEVIKTNVGELKQVATRALNRLGAALAEGETEALETVLTMLSRFPRYSAGNVVLIWAQEPVATHVAGFRTWNRLGRSVRAGERAIRILAPVICPADGSEDEESVAAFRPVSVFDVRQTEGTFEPDMDGQPLDASTAADRLSRWSTDEGLSVAWIDDGDDEWAIRKNDHETIERLFVLLYNVAQELLLPEQILAPVEDTWRSVEAEAVSFVVCRAVGLEPPIAPSGLGPLSERPDKALFGALDRIQRTAGRILEGIGFLPKGLGHRNGRRTTGRVPPLHVFGGELNDKTTH
jgi:antirestriction factor ArdC-like protein